MTRDWKTGKVFAVPESVAYDPSSHSIFVSNYDGYNPSGLEGRQAIVRIPADGTGMPDVFVSGMRNPTGLAIAGGILFAIEPDGTILVSHNEGRLYRVGPTGAVTLLLDLSVTGTNIADFTIDQRSGRVIVPTFIDNRVMAFRLPPAPQR